MEDIYQAEPGFYLGGEPIYVEGSVIIQRLNTHGGAAPAQPCTQEGQEGRTPYRADYVFLD